MQVINVWGRPGIGKSTTAAGIFEKMKLRGYNVELVNEYAKDMVWENRGNILSDQLYILAKQHRKILRLANEVDFVVTDSPILMGLVYTSTEYFPSFFPLVKEIWDSFDNINILLRSNPNQVYNPVGRVQGTIEQAELIHYRIVELLDRQGIESFSFDVSSTVSGDIVDYLFDTSEETNKFLGWDNRK